MTAAIVAASAADVDFIWYGAAAFAAGDVSHLLPRSWEVIRGSNARPSLCGEQRRRVWRPVDSWPDPGRFRACRECARLVVHARTGNPTAARVTARAEFLDGSLPMSPEALSYVPLAAVERADTYAATAGGAESWPIPLTPCTQ